jgi:TetR/AcrR family transcriptional regulator
MAARGNRKQEILEALAHALEAHPGSRITTAALAAALGVSEAALYRHFPSKARMFEGLIAFAEEAVFSRVNRILDEEKDTRARCASLLYLLLGFADRNPGIARVLLGDALVGENERLHERVQQFFERLTTQFRQILRESELRGDVLLCSDAEAGAGLLVAYVEGRMQQFQRTRFKQPSAAALEQDWAVLQRGLFGTA